MNMPLIERRSDKPQAYDGEERRRQQHYLDMAQQVADMQDARRYRLIRSLSQMSQEEQDRVTDSMDIFYGQVDRITPEQFDAAIDAAIAAQAKGGA